MLSGNQYIYKNIIFQISAVRTGVCAYMDATLLDILTWLINLTMNLVLIPFTNKSKASKYDICYSLVQFRKNVCQIVLYQCAFLALQGFKLT